jgi:hypothetical protein
LGEKKKAKKNEKNKKKHVGKHCNKTKTMWGNIVTIYSVLKKKNYEAKFSTSSI